MIKVGLIGLGKMGISHCAIINAHADAELVAVCDTSRFILSFLERYAGFGCYKDYRKMIDTCNLDCIVIATPTTFHMDMVRYSLETGLHVFVEKPFCLRLEEGRELVAMANMKGVVNLVGYHNRFISTFQEAKRLLGAKVIGEVYHVTGEAYGPVVLREKGGTWRTKATEGGGCLYDYASHVVNLVQYFLGSPDHVAGTVVKSIYSRNVDDAVYATLLYNNGLDGQLSVNWSDESYRKMSTQITVLGKQGKIIVDAQELKIYLRNRNETEKLDKGWNIRYLTDLIGPVNYYLRGEEYSAQIDYFIQCIKANNVDNRSSFASALETDEVINMLVENVETRNK